MNPENACERREKRTNLQGTPCKQKNKDVLQKARKRRFQYVGPFEVRFSLPCPFLGRSVLSRKTSKFAKDFPSLPNPLQPWKNQEWKKLTRSILKEFLSRAPFAYKDGRFASSFLLLDIGFL